MSNVQFFNRGKTGEIWLYDVVGASKYGTGMSADSFRKQLSALGKVDTINLRINSPGGSLTDGNTIYNTLKNHPATIVVDIDGLAASIATIIAMAASPGKLRIASNGLMMIHEPECAAFGNRAEMSRTIEALDRAQHTIVDTYQKRTGQKKSTIEDWMSKQTWFTAGEAVQSGFADAITDEQPITACFDLENFHNVPAAYKRRGVTASGAAQRVRLHRQAELLRST